MNVTFFPRTLSSNRITITTLQSLLTMFQTLTSVFTCTTCERGIVISNLQMRKLGPREVKDL